MGGSVWVAYPKNHSNCKGKEQISISDSSASYQSWFPRDSTKVSSEESASQGPPTEAARIHIHLSTLNISPPHTPPRESLVICPAPLALCLPVSLWACQPECSQLLGASVGMRAGKGFENCGQEGGVPLQRSGHPTLPEVLGMLK